MSHAARRLLSVLLALSAVDAADAAMRAPAPAPIQVKGPGVTGTVIRYPSLHSTHVAPMIRELSPAKPTRRQAPLEMEAGTSSRASSRSRHLGSRRPE